MASDAAAVLHAAGVESAHVFGVSMGGMIALEFALQYPSRVRSLILGCTAAGGPHAVQAESAALQTLMRRDLTPEESKEAIIPFIYDAATSRERIDEDMASRMKWFPPHRDMQTNFKESLAGKPTAALCLNASLPYHITSLPLGSALNRNIHSPIV